MDSPSRSIIKACASKIVVYRPRSNDGAKSVAEFWFDPKNRQRLSDDESRTTWTVCVGAPNGRFVMPALAITLGLFLYQVRSWLWGVGNPHYLWASLGFLALMSALYWTVRTDLTLVKKLKNHGILVTGVMTETELGTDAQGDPALIISFQINRPDGKLVSGKRVRDMSSAVSPGSVITALVLPDGRCGLL